VSRAAAEVGSTANSYQILAKLAAGGMAEIFLARGKGVAGVERYCVVKRVLPDRASDVQFVRMFLDEARLAAQLQHANIAQVYDIGKLGDSYFFTMEYVHGETVRALLHRALGRGRPLPIHCALTIAAGTAAGLHHAHARVGFDGRALGIVHRDVSPSNLMVSYEGGVKVVDFGVAKASDRSQETKSGTVKGKIGYLSPEQCKGKRVDRRSDLFSLGICFWEMLTLERLYKRASDFDNMNAIVTEAPPPPSSRRADVPREIDELVLRLLAKAPDDRYQTADEVVEAIEGVAGRTGTVLSASALGRFVRELFGQRPEPWLEAEAHQEPGEAVTVTSEPIPPELVIPLGDQVNRQLASVLDLSAHRAVTESIDLSPGPLLDLAPAPARTIPVELADTQLSHRAQLGLPLAAPPTTSSGIAQPDDAEAASALPPPPPVPPPVPRSGPRAIPAAPSGALPAPVSPAVSQAPSQPSLRTSASIRMPDRRVPWPLYAVICGAAVLGSVAVTMMMRSSPSESTADVASATRAPGRAGPPPSTITVVPIEPAELESAAAPPAGIAAPAVEPAPAPSRSIEPLRLPAPPRRSVTGMRRELAGKPSPPAPAAGKRDPEDDAIARLYAAEQYDNVVEQCSAGPVTAEHAPLCFLAACHAGNEARARKLFAAVPAARRDVLTTNCKQLGVDLTAQRKPDPSAEQCAADPTACQR
jgi:serine/threonine protein kinase